MFIERKICGRLVSEQYRQFMAFNGWTNNLIPAVCIINGVNDMNGEFRYMSNLLLLINSRSLSKTTRTLILMLPSHVFHMKKDQPFFSILSKYLEGQVIGFSATLFTLFEFALNICLLTNSTQKIFRRV